ncbi:MAG: glycosyltransferase family 39 protein [Deltaproteobacteria bacterium]|nr:glycosyltransferase family 39 protein [Deltaproteobacteria bacterium]
MINKDRLMEPAPVARPDQNQHIRSMSRSLFWGMVVFTSAQFFWLWWKSSLGFDESLYLIAARNLYERGTFSFQNDFTPLTLLPLYSFVSAPFFALLHDPEWIDCVVHLCSAMWLGFATGQLTKTLFGNRAACLLLYLLAVLPATNVTILYSGTQVLYLAFFTTAAWCLWSAVQSQRVGMMLAAGASVGAALWARAEGLLLAVGLCGTLLGLLRWRRIRWSTGWLLILCYAAPITLAQVGKQWWFDALDPGNVVGGKLVRMLEVGGDLFQFEGMGKSGDFQAVLRDAELSFQSEFSGAEVPAGLSDLQILWHLATVKPTFFLKRIVKNVRFFCYSLPSLQVFPFFLFPLLGVCMCFVARARESAVGLFWLSSGLALPSLGYLVFGVSNRYLVPLTIPLAVMVGASFDCMLNRCSVWGRPIVAAVLLLLGCASLVYVGYQRTATYLRPTVQQSIMACYQRVTRHLELQHLENPAVITTNPKPILYGGLNVRWRNLNDVVRALPAVGHEYVEAIVYTFGPAEQEHLEAFQRVGYRSELLCEGDGFQVVQLHAQRR